MPDIPPASAASSASTAAVAPSANNIVIETTVNSVPDKIQQLARQIEVSGTLAEAPAGNAITINTMIGPLTLLLPQLAQAQQDRLLQQLTTLFQSQKPLTVVLQPGNPPAQALLLLPSLTTASQNQQPAASAFLQSSAAAQAAPPLLPNTSVSAVVLPNGIGPAFIASGQAGQTPYAALNPNTNAGSGAGGNNSGASSLETPGIPLADGGLMAAQDQPSPNSPAAQNGPALSNAAPSAANAPLLQPGTELDLQINAVIAPAAQNPAALPIPQAPNQLLATVVGNGTGGQLILKAGEATLFVRQPANLPAGTQVLVTVAPSRAAAPALLPLPEIEQFPALQQVIAALAPIDPAAARALAAAIPQPNENLPGGLLFFLSAIRQGDVRGWLGNGALDLLTGAGKTELVGKLAQEFQQTGQTAHDNTVGEWRAYTVPLQDNGQFTALHFYVHGDRERHAAPQGGADGKTGGPAQVRFLIDVRMSRLGALQLDGFLRPRKLDIIVRSEQALPAGLDNELRLGYARTMDAIGYNGALGFQNGRQGWLNIQRPATGRAVVT